MRFNPRHCPHCGELAKGTAENVPGRCDLEFDENGDAEYDGDGTKLFWDGAETDTDDEGRVLLLCSNGHDWRAEVEPETEAPQA